MTYRNDTADTEPTARGLFQESWHLADAVLAQDVQGRDTSPGTPAWAWITGQGHWHPTERRAKATWLLFPTFLASCLFPPAATSFSIPPSPKATHAPAPQVHTWALRKVPPEPVYAIRHRSCSPLPAGFVFRLQVLERYQKCKIVVWPHRLIAGLQQKKTNNPTTENTQLLMVSNPQGKQPSEDPHHLKELGVSQNIRRRNLPKVYPCFTTASERFSQDTENRSSTGCLPEPADCPAAARGALLGCLLRDKRTRRQKTEAVEGFSFPTSSTGTLKQISPY